MTTNENNGHDNHNFGQELREETAAVRLSVSRFGSSRKLESEQIETAAKCFDAERDSLSASKKLIDTKDEAYKSVSAILNGARALWESCTCPFPERGIRLIRRAAIANFESKMEGVKGELSTAVETLDRKYGELLDQARHRLGSLFNSNDYPASIASEFSIDWDYPSVGTPTYLQQVATQLYESQCRRVERQFDDAISLFEQAMTAELHEMVSHLCERLSGSDDGKKKVFRSSAVENIHKFAERFRNLSVRSNAELEGLVGQAEQLIDGVSPDNLRKDDGFRNSLRGKMEQVAKALDAMLVEKPGRKFFDEA